MDTSQVERDLNLWIAQSREWVSSEAPVLSNISFRNHDWTATAVEFLDNPRRIERHGIKFDFSLIDANRNFKAQLNIRIKPEATIGEKGDSWPYVVIYVVNQSTGKDDAIIWQHIEVADSYEDMVGLSIEDWYLKWLAYALVSKGSKKILSPDMRVPI